MVVMYCTSLPCDFRSALPGHFFHVIESLRCAVNVVLLVAFCAGLILLVLLILLLVILSTKLLTLSFPVRDNNVLSVFLLLFPFVSFSSSISFILFYEKKFVIMSDIQ